MNDFTARDEIFLDLAARLPPGEKYVVLDALHKLGEAEPWTKQDGMEFLQEFVIAHNRTRRRAASDKRTDHARRVLIGARLPRDTVAIYRAQAHAQGISLYRWVSDALAAYAARPLGEEPAEGGDLDG